MKFEELSEQVYEDLNGRIVATIKREQTYQVIFECDDWLGPSQRQRFTLEFGNVAEFNVTPGECGVIYATADHPLLWDQNEDLDSIYFSSRPANPAEFLGLLYSAHCSLVKGWRPFSQYAHADLSLLQRGDGLLAEGPRRVIEAYATIAEGRVRYSIVHKHTLRGGYQVVFFEKDYIICQTLPMIKLDVNEP